MRRTSLSTAPLPAIGYVLTLFGFVFLGTFTASLALGSSTLAIVFGIAMLASYGLGLTCFMLRKRYIATADPDADITLGFDPIRGNTDRRAAERYLARYRGRDAEVATLPTGASEPAVRRAA